MIVDKTKEPGLHELDWWTDELVPILEKFVEASEGKTDKKFRAEIYKRTDPGSGERCL